MGGAGWYPRLDTELETGPEWELNFAGAFSGNSPIADYNLLQGIPAEEAVYLPANKRGCTFL